MKKEVIIVGALILGALQGRAADPVGWHIQVNDCKSGTLTFWIGYKESPKLTNWRVWHEGDSNDFQLPIEYRYVWDIHLNADCGHQQADFNLMYNEHVVKQWHFDGQPEDHTVTLEDRDEPMPVAQIINEIKQERHDRLPK